MRPIRLLFVAALAAGGLLATASPAAAHPFVTGGATAPASSLASIELEMGHGCGTEGAGGGDPTVEVALEVPDSMTYVEASDTDEYTVEVETGDDGQAEVVAWTATGEGVPAPTLPLDVVIDGEEGDEVYLPVFQGCDGFEYRWIGTPDEPAKDPAVLLTLSAPDPDSPPPSPEPSTEEPGTDSTASETPEPPTSDDTTDPTMRLEPAPDEADEAPDPTPDLADAPPTDEGTTAWLPILLGVIALAAVAVAIAAGRRRRSSGPSAGPPSM